LLFAADLASHFGEEGWAAIWSGAAGRAREAIQRLFWSETAGHLADALTPAGPVLTLRPHQLFAIGLPHCLLPANRALSVLAAVERDLLTPVGLRACAPGQESDGADAFAWPVLMGLYFDALIRLRGEEGKRLTREWLRSFAGHLDEAGLGFVSERFESQPPHRPSGQIAQAAATAELLRISHRVAGRPPAIRSSAPPR
jgi:glycogen debranching enzyme